MVAASTMCIMVQPTYLVLRVAHKAPTVKAVAAISPIMQASVATHKCCTILGYVLLFVGVCWATNLWGKLKALCGSSRASRTAEL